MKNIIFYCSVTLVILFTFLLTSCERVIEIDLSSVTPKLVVEATINDSGEPARVKLSKTIDFSKPNTFPTITNATIRLADDKGNETVLRHKGEGVYESTELKGTQGTTYTLTIQAEGKNYTAVSKMPKLVSFDSAWLGTQSFFGTSSKTPNIRFRDPQILGDYYRFRVQINQKKLGNVLVLTDNISNGQTVSRGLNLGNSNDAKIVKNDTVRIEMQCIDNSAYLYFFSLSQLDSGPNQSATPANPVSNIKGSEVLGYFSAYTTQSRQIIAD
jgi:hypothetical protein